jgi:protein TonB
MLRPTHAISQSQNGFNNNRRALAVALVASLHILLIWGLAKGMAPMIIQTFDDLVVVPIAEKKPPKTVDVVLPPVQPRIDMPTVDRPIIDIESDPGPGAITVTSPEPVKEARVAIADTGPVAANARTIPPYPALAARMGVEGKVIIKLTISESGFVTAADLVKSSGSSELDRAAISWVMANWKYKPATHDGQPVASTTEVSVNFTLSRR